AGLQVSKDGHFLRVLMINDSVEAGFGVDLGFWNAGQNYHLSIVWDSDVSQGSAPSAGVTVTLLIDGSEVGRANGMGRLQVLPGASLAIAAPDSGVTIRNFRLYERRS